MNEGTAISPEEINRKWADILNFYNNLIDAENFQLRPIRFLVRHIIEYKYSHVIYGGTSLYSLLLSLPVNGKINYTKTLSINYDQQTQVAEFKYWDCSQKERTANNTVWTERCQATEVVDTFEYFVKEHSDWKQKLKETHANKG